MGHRGPAPACPYRGLSPFAAEDAPFFFGRDTEVQLIAANLRAARLIVLYGASGVGKSSVLGAGVVHQLSAIIAAEVAEEGRASLAVVLVRDWGVNALNALLAAAEAAIEGSLGGRHLAPLAPTLGWAEALSARSREFEGDLLLILDQFEEVLLAHPADEGPGTLVFELPRLVNDPAARVHVLLSLRDDALSLLDRFQGELRQRLENRLRLRPLSAAAGRLAIEGPLARLTLALGPGEAPFAAEPELVEEVLCRVVRPHAGEAEEALAAPYLELILTRLWQAETAAGSRLLRRSTLERLGRLDQVVDEHVRGVLSRLPAALRRAARKALRHLVTPSGAKVALGVEDLAPYTGLGQARLEALLSRLSAGEARLLRPVGGGEGGGPTRYEVFHDLLARPLRDWWQVEHGRAEQRRLALGITSLAMLAVAGLWSWQHQRELALRRTRLDTLPLLAASLDDPLAGALLLAESDPQREPPQGIAIANRLAAQWLPRQVLRGHDGAVESLAYGARGLLLSGSADGTMRLWDLRNGGRTKVLAEHRGRAGAVALSPDGRLAASGGDDGRVQLCAIAGTEPCRDFLRARGWIALMGFGARGERLVVWDSAGITLWDVAAGTEVRAFTPATDFANGFAFAMQADGSSFAADLPFEGLSEVRSEDGAILRQLPERGLDALAFCPSDRRLAFARREGWVGLVEPRASASTSTLYARAQSLACLPSGELVVGTADGGVELWTTINPKLLRATRALRDSTVALAVAPQGRAIAAGLSDGSIRIYEPEAPAYPITLGTGFTRTGLGRITAAGIVGAAFSRAGDAVTLVDEDGLARHFALAAPEAAVSSLDTGEEEGESVVRDAAFDPRGSDAVATLLPDSGVRLGTLGGAFAWLVQTQGGAPATAAALLPGGREVVVGFHDGILRIAPQEGSAPQRELTRMPASVAALAVSPDGDLLASGDVDGNVLLLSLRERADGTSRWAKEGSVADLSFDASGRYLAMAWENGRAALVGLEDGLPLTELTEAGPKILTLAIAPGGTLVALGRDDGRVTLWQPQGTRSPAELGRLEGAVLSLAFSPDGSRLVAGSTAGEAKVWTVSWPRLLDQLRASTRACLTAEQRLTYLAESRAQAQARELACTRGQSRSVVPLLESARRNP